jgi:hypothetical protein
MVKKNFVAGKNVLYDVGVDLNDDNFADDQDGNCNGTRIKDFPNIVKSRIPDHTVISAVSEEHQYINCQYNEDTIPSTEHGSFMEVIVIHEKHGYQVRDKQYHDIKYQNPGTRQRIIGLFSEKEVTYFK